MIPLLRIRGLSKEFKAGALEGGRRVRVLHQVDLDVYPRETLGLVGESGCGKTTLARCALRLIEPTSGGIEFDGMDLRALSRAALRAKRREFQMVFQDPFASLNPRMTVAEIVSEPFRAHGLGTRRDREQWVRELLEAVALDASMMRRAPALLSGGQQQRVAIARALALKPRLLVADEPVSALDASVQAQILNLLADLQRRFGLTLILISHALPVVHYLSTRVAVMYLGRVVEEAPSAPFFSEPRHPYSRMLLKSMPVLELQAPALKARAAGEIPSPSSPPPGCAFHPRCPEVMARCREQVPALTPCDKESKIACFLYT